MSSAFVFEVGLALCLQISIVVLGTIALQRLTNSTRMQCRLWTMCFVAILGLTAVALLLPHRRILAFPSISGAATVRIMTWQAWIVTGLVISWLSGTVVSLARRGIRYWVLLKFFDLNCQTLSSGQLDSLPLDVEGADKRFIMGNRQLRHLQIMACDRIAGPFCWQLHRPVIVLPQQLLKEDTASLRHVLLHELEHLRTQHPMQLFLQGTCSTIFWFHPLVWWAAQRAELTREFLCDEVAALEGGSVSGYLRTVVKIAEGCRSSSCSAPEVGTLGFGNRESALVRRSNRLVKLASEATYVNPFRSMMAFSTMIAIIIAVNFLWLPVNAAASTRSEWSPWPSWSAKVLHDVGFSARDFELFDERSQLGQELHDD
ncbi:M56 family metallopeptidase [Planctomycetes bacterium TBK1r]|uniref:Regulatory protein BlaR1 n=1 Tax=Stieleria magnilauensis TaxID=2527963 RepID=A0ABX5XVB8_9BACT|nr:Regulatory protein BlaR1 [Planctomycetes bacterium TBK1r]